MNQNVDRNIMWLNTDIELDWIAWHIYVLATFQLLELHCASPVMHCA